jgi:hypothetical protein
MKKELSFDWLAAVLCSIRHMIGSMGKKAQLWQHHSRKNLTDKMYISYILLGVYIIEVF